MVNLVKWFGIEQRGSNLRREFLAGAATFFAMSYIIIINPMILSQTGVPYGAVYIATILSSVLCTLIMAFFANVPYVLASGLSLNSFVSLTICQFMGFTWQEGLAMVFLCGLFNVFVTVTQLRRTIVKAIPDYLQNAIGIGIGGFIACAGIRNINLAEQAPQHLSIVLASMIVLGLLWYWRINGDIMLGMMVMTAVCMILGLSAPGLSDTGDLGSYVDDFCGVVGAAFTEGMPSLLAEHKLFIVFTSILTLSLSDVFDTLGTFVGTGRVTGIFSDENTVRNSRGLTTNLDRALFADSIATPIGALLGTTNVTTYIESAVGISVGGRTGFTSLTTAFFMLLAIFAAPIATAVPLEVNAAVLIVIGLRLAGNYRLIEWRNIGQGIPALGTIAGMMVLFSITYGLAIGLVLHCLVEVIQSWRHQGRVQINPVLLGCTILFAIDFVMMYLM